MHILLEEFVSRVNASLSDTVPFKRFARVFDIDAWLDGFLHGGGTAFFQQQAIEQRLGGWIQESEFSKLNAWADFCRRKCSAQCRAAGLLAIARRSKKVAPSQALELLFEAQRSNSEFFFEHGTLAHDICAEAMALDPQRGRELLLDSFRREYQRFPQMIVYRLDNALGFIEAFADADRDALYEVWAQHNRRLTAGLTPKPVNVQWVTEGVDGRFSDHCLEYLLWLLDYSVVDVRRLALANLHELFMECALSFESVLARWDALSSNQKEHVATLAFSLALAPANQSAELWKPLISRAFSENHFNLRRTVAEAVICATSEATRLDPDLVNSAQTLASRPPTIVPLRPTLELAPGAKDFSCLSYQRWLLDRLEELASSCNVRSRVRSHLVMRHPDFEVAWDEEKATHRAYNINTNFDVIEISGRFDSAVREAINLVLHELIQAHEVKENDLKDFADLLRLYDPTDLLVEPGSRPARVNWISPNLSESSFLSFQDWDDLKRALQIRDQTWVTVFEDCEQRSGDGSISGDGPATRVHVVLFGVKGGGRGQQPKPSGARTVQLRNRYRFELRQPPAGLSALRGRESVPIVQVSSNALRGRHHLDTASLRPDIASELCLTPRKADWFSYELGGEAVTRSVEWQEAFDQGRRRHEPRSSGFLLEMKRDTLLQWARRHDLALWVELAIERTADKFEPESHMNWRKHHEVFALDIASQDSANTVTSGLP
jgi:hypothetical protein